MYLPSNGATTNVVHHDLDLHFQGHDFWNVNMWKMVRTSEKYSRVTFICHQMELIWMLYSMTLTKIFKVKHFLFFWIFYKTIAQYADIPSRFALTRTAPAMELLLFYLPIHLPTKPPINPPVSLSVCSPTLRSAGPSERWFVRMFVCLSTCPSICPLVQPSIHPHDYPSIDVPVLLPTNLPCDRPCDRPTTCPLDLWFALPPVHTSIRLFDTHLPANLHSLSHALMPTLTHIRYLTFSTDTYSHVTCYLPGHST